MGSKSSIEVVRGRIDAALGEELLAFWAERGALTDERARERVSEVVCVTRLDGELVGVCSVYAADVPLIGGRRFWIYRNLLDEAAAEQQHAMIRATFEALDSERQGDPIGKPFGLCVFLDPGARRGLLPEAEWRDPRMIYAGYLPDGRQMRIAYFSDQVAGPTREGGPTPPAGYRVGVFADQDDVTQEDVVEMWTRAGVLTRAAAEDRVQEALVIATDAQRKPVGISTAYLDNSARLHAQLWHYRTFVLSEHRRARLSTIMFVVARNHLEHRFVSGADRRGIGLLLEIEYEAWKPPTAHGLWPASDTLLIGNNARGDHMRVHYFPGALAPEPDG